jgi:predicted amidohydrolase
LIGMHRKIFLPWPPNGMEKMAFKPGDGAKAFDTRLGRIGLMICYEMAFPEVSRALALSGAELIAVSSAWMRVKDPPGRERVYDLAPVCRAFENNLFIAISNMVGKDDGMEFQGKSKIIDPMGRVVVECSERDEVAIVKEIDMDLVGEVRKAVPYFLDAKDGIERVWRGSAKIEAPR